MSQEQVNKPSTPPGGPAQGGTPTPPSAPAKPGVIERRAPAKAPPRKKSLPPYKVLLHNDDVHDVMFVVETLLDLTPLTAEAATKVTLEAHKSGVALVLVTHKERAELYQDQLTSKGLTSTIEPE